MHSLPIEGLHPSPQFAAAAVDAALAACSRGRAVAAAGAAVAAGSAAARAAGRHVAAAAPHSAALPRVSLYASCRTPHATSRLLQSS